MFLDQGWWHLQLHWPMQRRPKVPERRKKKSSSFEKFSQNWKQSCEILQHFTEHNDTGHHVLWEASTLFCSVATGNKEYRVKRTTFLGSSPFPSLNMWQVFTNASSKSPHTHTRTYTHTQTRTQCHTHMCKQIQTKQKRKYFFRLEPPTWWYYLLDRAPYRESQWILENSFICFLLFQFCHHRHHHREHQHCHHSCHHCSADPPQPGEQVHRPVW